MKKFRAIPVVVIWLVLTVFVWFSPAEEMSDAERRKLAQFPEFSGERVLDGSFMEDFDAYSLDQFPMREGFRRVKSFVNYYVLGQKDNNGIYISDGYAAQMEYPLKESSVEYALKRFGFLYEKYLTDSKVFAAIVPDKGYYLAENSGHLALDYEKMFSLVKEGMPWAEFIDLTDTLSIEDYYRTDTHWRQENLPETAGKICAALGVTAPNEEDFVKTALERPFYGVYYGQAALPMEPETMYILESETLKNCSVFDYETGKTTSVYDFGKLESKDLYDVFLSGARSLLEIRNPNAKTDRKLVVFRDSFGCAMVPLLVQDYATVVMIDVRYIQPEALEEFVEFEGRDVLFLYSTLVLNNSAAIK